MNEWKGSLINGATTNTLYEWKEMMYTSILTKIAGFVMNLLIQRSCTWEISVLATQSHNDVWSSKYARRINQTSILCVLKWRGQVFSTSLMTEHELGLINAVATIRCQLFIFWDNTSILLWMLKVVTICPSYFCDEPNILKMTLIWSSVNPFFRPKKALQHSCDFSHHCWFIPVIINDGLSFSRSKKPSLDFPFVRQALLTFQQWQ